MDIARKITLAENSIKSITRHDDEDSLVRKAAVARLKKFMDSELSTIETRAIERAAKIEKGDDEAVSSGHGSGEANTLGNPDVANPDGAALQ